MFIDFVSMPTKKTKESEVAKVVKATKGKKKTVVKKKEASVKKVVVVKKTPVKKVVKSKKPKIVTESGGAGSGLKAGEVVIKVDVPVNPDGSFEIHKEFVIVHSCNNCDHIPIRVGNLVGIFAFIVAVLSTVILIQLGFINLEQVLLAVGTPVNAATEWVNQL